MVGGDAPEALRLDPVDAETLRPWVGREREVQRLSVLLTDCSYVTVMGQFMFLDEGLSVEGIIDDETWLVGIPSSSIAGVERLETVAVDDKSVETRLRQDAFAELFELAKQHGFMTAKLPAKHLYAPRGSITPGNLSRQKDQIVYNDRAFFELIHRRGGGAEIVLGLPGRLGFTDDNSLLDLINESVREKPTTDLGAVCQVVGFVHLRGFVHLIDEGRPQTGSLPEQHMIEVEDKLWYPAIITASSDNPEPGSSPWILARLCRPGFKCERPAWMHFRQPFQIFGEVVHQCYHLDDLGTTDCFVLARVIAFLKRDVTS